MSTLNRRVNPRANVMIPGAVFIKSDPTNKYEAEILDLSIGGAFVHCTAPILIGQEIILEILFDRANFNVDAKVVQAYDPKTTVSKQTSVVRWVRGSSKSGFGVQFTALTDVSKKYLQDIVDALVAPKAAGS